MIHKTNVFNNLLQALKKKNTCVRTFGLQHLHVVVLNISSMTIKQLPCMK